MAIYGNALSTVSIAAQTLPADGLVVFSTNVVDTGCMIDHVAGSTDTELRGPGVYPITFNADVIPVATGQLTVRLLSNGTPVPGAQTTITGVAAVRSNVAFAGIVKVLPSCPFVINKANIQVQVSAATNVENANLGVTRN